MGTIQVFSAIGQSFSTKNLKKTIDEKNQEISKVYNYIGIEVYDMIKSGKITLPELDVYMEKIADLKKDIEDLEDKIAKSSMLHQCNYCGAGLEPNARFCKECGKAVDENIITCDCGKLLKRDVKFCPNCGTNIRNIIETFDENTKDSESVRECICGAIIPKGQSLCMECGRSYSLQD